MTVRAHSAFYATKVLATAAKFDLRFSITAPQDKRVRAAIDAIPEQAWQPIPCWLSTPEVSGADIAVIALDTRPATVLELAGGAGTSLAAFLDARRVVGQLPGDAAARPGER